MPRILLLPLLAASLLLLACTSSASAGQYTLAYDFGTDLSGWSGYVEPSYLLCGTGATSGCPDATTSRIMARSGVGQPLWSQGRWEWTAPPGTTIAGGALAYRTRMRHPEFYARVKTRADGGAWDLAPTLVNEQQTTALTDHVLPLAAGFRQIGVSLYSHPAAAGLVTEVWDDYLTLVRLDVTVDDPTPPSLAWVAGGGLLDGGWHSGDVCGTLAFADAQSGLGAAWLESGGISTTWVAPRTGSQYQPGIPSAQPTLCLSAAALGDGLHAGTAGASDVSTGQAAPLAFSVAIDATPPTAAVVSPAAVATGAQPVVSLNVADNLSGVASVLAQVDGTTVPLSLVGATASGTPVAALAYGPHTLAWSVVDGAGNRTSATSAFAVADTTPPAFGSPRPANGAVLAGGDVLAVAVTVTDNESGIDPASIALTLDGAAVEHVWQAAGLVQGVSAGRLAPGTHHLELHVADLAGNAGRLVWDVSVPAPPAVAGSAPATGGSAPAAGGSITGGAAPVVPVAPAGQGAVTVRAVVARISGPRARAGGRAPARPAAPAHRGARSVRPHRQRAPDPRERAWHRCAEGRVRRRGDGAHGREARAAARAHRGAQAAARPARAAGSAHGADRRARERPPRRAARAHRRDRGAHCLRVAPGGIGSRRRLRRLRHVVRDRARRRVRRARRCAPSALRRARRSC